MSRVWKIGIVIIVVVAGSLATMAAVWAASGTGGGGMGLRHSLRMTASGNQGLQARRGAGAGACGTSMGDPAALREMQALRQEHAGEMREWLEKYRDGPQSGQAQEALQALRVEHRRDMRELFETYGVGGAPCGGANGPGAAGCPYGGREAGERPGRAADGMMGPGAGMMGSGGWE